MTLRPAGRLPHEAHGEVQPRYRRQARCAGPRCRAAVVSTLLLLLTYVVGSFAAQANGGEQFLVTHQDDGR
jgi:hypothetical protein